MLQGAFSEAAQSEPFRAFLTKRGEQGIGGTSDEFRDKILAEYLANGSIIEGLGLSKK